MCVLVIPHHLAWNNPVAYELLAPYAESIAEKICPRSVDFVEDCSRRAGTQRLVSLGHDKGPPPKEWAYVVPPAASVGQGPMQQRTTSRRCYGVTVTVIAADVVDFPSLSLTVNFGRKVPVAVYVCEKMGSAPCDETVPVVLGFPSPQTIM